MQDAGFHVSVERPDIGSYLYGIDDSFISALREVDVASCMADTFINIFQSSVYQAISLCEPSPSMRQAWRARDIDVASSLLSPFDVTAPREQGETGATPSLL